jgi:hypothetical protein
MSKWISEQGAWHPCIYRHGLISTVVLIPGWPEQPKLSARCFPSWREVTELFAWTRQAWEIQRHRKQAMTPEPSPRHCKR